MIEVNRPVKRKVYTARENVVLTLYPGAVIGFRRLRCRKEYIIPVATCYRVAIEAEQARKREEKRKARGGKLRVRRGSLSL
jgi:hypothetical protein